jgi:hypothetical protein
VLRVVVRNGLSRDLATLLITDLKAVVDRFEKGGAPQVEPPEAEKTGFHH